MFFLFFLFFFFLFLNTSGLFGNIVGFKMIIVNYAIKITMYKENQLNV